jgi:hypothetical protein
VPRDKQPPGEAQEKSVRARLTNQGYEGPYGSTDAQIKKRLGIKGRCADFVGYHPKEGKWLICESKGGDMDTAYEQLKNTMNGLLAKEPASNGKTDLRIYTSPHNYQKLTQEPRM